MGWGTRRLSAKKLRARATRLGLSRDDIERVLFGLFPGSTPPTVIHQAYLATTRNALCEVLVATMGAHGKTELELVAVWKRHFGDAPLAPGDLSDPDRRPLVFAAAGALLACGGVLVARVAIPADPPDVELQLDGLVVSPPLTAAAERTIEAAVEEDIEAGQQVKIVAMPPGKAMPSAETLCGGNTALAHGTQVHIDARTTPWGMAVRCHTLAEGWWTEAHGSETVVAVLRALPILESVDPDETSPRCTVALPPQTDWRSDAAPRVHWWWRLVGTAADAWEPAEVGSIAEDGTQAEAPLSAGRWECGAALSDALAPPPSGPRVSAEVERPLRVHLDWTLHLDQGSVPPACVDPAPLACGDAIADAGPGRQPALTERAYAETLAQCAEVQPVPLPLRFVDREGESDVVVSLAVFGTLQSNRKWIDTTHMGAVVESQTQPRAACAVLRQKKSTAPVSAGQRLIPEALGQARAEILRSVLDDNQAAVVAGLAHQRSLPRAAE